MTSGQSCTSTPLQRPIPAVRGQLLARAVVRRIDRDAGAARGQRHVPTGRVVDFHLGERERVQDVLDQRQIARRNPDLLGRTGAETEVKIELRRRVAGGPVADRLPLTAVLAQFDGDRCGHATADLGRALDRHPTQRAAHLLGRRALAKHDVINNAFQRQIETDPHGLYVGPRLGPAHPARLAIAVDQVNRLQRQVVIFCGARHARRGHAEIIPLDLAAVFGVDFHSWRRVSHLQRQVVQQVGRSPNTQQNPNRLIGTSPQWACTCGCSLASVTAVLTIAATHNATVLRFRRHVFMASRFPCRTTNTAPRERIRYEPFLASLRNASSLIFSLSGKGSCQPFLKANPAMTHSSPARRSKQ